MTLAFPQFYKTAYKSKINHPREDLYFNIYIPNTILTYSNFLQIVTIMEVK